MRYSLIQYNTIQYNTIQDNWKKWILPIIERGRESSLLNSLCRKKKKIKKESENKIWEFKF